MKKNATSDREENRNVELLQEENSRKNEEIERLKKELKAKTEKCRRYEGELMNNSIADRWKIGKYLHDNLAQKLTIAKIMLCLLREKLSGENIDAAAEFEEIIGIIDEGTQDVRNLSHEIIPVNIEKEGIFEAFKYLEEQVKTRHGVNCSLENREILHKIDNTKTATNLYHIAQEAIKNAVIHGEAKNINIKAIEDDQKFYLHIKDDGKGFDSSNTVEGMGITIMKHRAEEMDGSFRIESANENDNFSTCVICEVPIQKFRDQPVI